MFSAVGPDRRCRAIRSSSRATRPWLRSRKVRRPSSSASAASKTPPSDVFVMERPPSPATTVETDTGNPLSVIATSVESTPPKPALMAFSTTTTRRAPLSAFRTASMGNGRNEVMPSAPIRCPAARCMSMTSLIVPSTDPMATTTTSASALRYGRTNPPESRPKASANSAPSSLMRPSAVSWRAWAR